MFLIVFVFPSVNYKWHNGVAVDVEQCTWHIHKG